ncbi:hypothetical protein HC891_08465 [Candidatus Gracilibacteria bacterium]|nr:hypothetical protein [Candidatus Gracilibacteria bacterium]
MRFRTHLWTSALAALLRYPHQPYEATLTVLAGTLIDVDHLVLYALQTGDWSISGALRYNRYRHYPLVPGDTRPRYGPLRSWLHRPIVLLPLYLAALAVPRLRPVALALSLHLALDHVDLPLRRRIRRAAGGRCYDCGFSDSPLNVYYFYLPQRVYQAGEHLPLCRNCYHLRLGNRPRKPDLARFMVDSTGDTRQ